MKKIAVKFVRSIREFVPKSIRQAEIVQTLWLSILNRKYITKRKPHAALSFAVLLTDHCNLNCKMCNTFCPLAEEYYLDINVFERDCARISELAGGRVEKITLTGGELLLHPQATKFFDAARKYFADVDIYIITNGILLPKQADEFWASCKRNSIKISVTQYPIKIDHDAIKRLAKKHEVALTLPDRDVKTQWWKIHLDLSGSQNAEKNFRLCAMSNTCIQLREGKLHTCPVLPNIKSFNRYFGKNLEVTERDYVDIYKAKSIDEMLIFLSKPVPFCRYCNVKKYAHNLAWGLSKRDISEWT
ncbi:MAG: radical SAM protein [Prevotellaceae bacterium]|nr:radical SAM protein [Prevotellaceae bacterium]